MSTKHLLLPSTLACPPRFGTPRDLTRATLGPAVGLVAKKLGKPLMPWQQFVVDVANEIDPATGEFAYDEVTLTVPRQSGKTTLILSRATHRASATKFFGRRQHIAYTAQTRKDARAKFIEEFIPDLEASPTFAGRMAPHLGNGDEHVRFANGSRFGIEATTEKSGHGPVLDEGFIDEAFAQVDSRVEDGMGPAMITRHSTLLWRVSTAGWKDRSPYLLDHVTVGRAHILSGAPGKLAYFEWSADDDADPLDEMVWWLCMPALGVTVPIEKIRSRLEAAQRAGNLNLFRRPYLNQWVIKDVADDPAIDAGAWADLIVDRGDQRPSPVAFSVTVSEDRQWTNIGLAGRRPDGRTHLQIIEARRGTRGVVDRLAELNRVWEPSSIAVALGTPAASLLPEMETAELPVTKLGPAERGAACGLFTDGVDAGTFAHTGQPQVAAAIGSTDKRTVGQAFEWKARGDVDISPLWALTLAPYALGKPPPAPTKKKRPGKYMGGR